MFNRFNPMMMVQQLQQDPAGMLQRAGLNVPADMRDPQQIIQHLMQSGQVPQQRYQQIMRMFGMFNR